jgi:hypothetical protein
MTDNLLAIAKLRAGQDARRRYVPPGPDALQRARPHWEWLLAWWAAGADGEWEAQLAAVSRGTVGPLLGNGPLEHIRAFAHTARAGEYTDIEGFHGYLAALLAEHGGRLAELGNDEAMLCAARRIYEDPTSDPETGDEIVSLHWGAPVAGRRPLLGW